jgi:Flp pilus assembly pilin Flp
MNLLRRGLVTGFLADAEAAVGAEHAILLALIAVAIFGAVSTFGTTVSNTLYTTSIAMLPFGS